jgi:hypothetical protein
MTSRSNQTYSVLELGSACARWSVRLIAPLRLESRCTPKLPHVGAGTSGRPCVKGKHLPKLAQVLKEPQPIWQWVRMPWHNGHRCGLEITSETSVWYRIGQPVLPVRWVIVRYPTSQLDLRAYVSTRPSDQPVGSSRRSSSGGPLKPLSTSAGSISGSRPNGRDRIKRLRAPRRVCSVYTRWWHCRLMCSTPRAQSLFPRPHSTNSRTRRSPMC